MRVRGAEAGGFVSAAVVILEPILSVGRGGVVRMAQTEKSARAGTAAMRRVVADIFIACALLGADSKSGRRGRRGGEVSEMQMRCDAMRCRRRELAEIARRRTGKSERSVQERQTTMIESRGTKDGSTPRRATRTRWRRAGGGKQGILFYFMAATTTVIGTPDADARTPWRTPGWRWQTIDTRGELAWDLGIGAEKLGVCRRR